jgi:hypothetical protein
MTTVAGRYCSTSTSFQLTIGAAPVRRCQQYFLAGFAAFAFQDGVSESDTLPSSDTNGRQARGKSSRSAPVDPGSTSAV